MKREGWPIYAVAVLGLSLNGYVLRTGSWPAWGWNLLPYLIAAFLALKAGRSLKLLVGAAAMLLVDGWFYLAAGAPMGPGSMALLSLLVTFKMFTVFPLGLALGWFAEKMGDSGRCPDEA